MTSSPHSLPGEENWSTYFKLCNKSDQLMSCIRLAYFTDMKQTEFFSKMKHLSTQLKKFFKDVIQGRIKIDVYSIS